MALVAARLAPEAGRPEADPQLPDATAVQEGSTSASSVAREESPAPRRVAGAYGRVLDYLWLGSLTIVALLASLGLVLALIGPYARAHAKDAVYTRGALVDCRSGGDCGNYLGAGWSALSDAGVHTTSSVATILLPPVHPSDGPLTLRLYGEPLFANEDQAFWIDILIDGRRAFHRDVHRGEAVPIFDAAFWLMPAAKTAPVRVTLVIGAAHAETKNARGRSTSGWRVESVSLY